MAEDAIAKARAQRDAAARTLADHNLGLLRKAQDAIAAMQPHVDALKATAAAMDPSDGRNNIGHLATMVASVASSLEHEAQVHQRTLARLADQA